jgi:signal transduction histidine kinase/FixJ family two-component response regulator
VGSASSLPRSRAFLLLRYTLVIATAYLLLVEENFALPPTGTLLLIAAALLSNVVATALPGRIVDSAYFTAGIIIGDTLWITAALVSSGQFNAEFFYLYFFVILLAAIGENLALIAVGALVACAAYVYLLSAAGGTWTFWTSPSIIRVPFLFTAAAFYGYLVDRTRREQSRALAAQAETHAKNTFLATVSHEIRTPMTGILGWTGLLLESDLAPQHREYAEGVQRSSQTLLAIINDILDFSKIEAGRMELRPTEFELREVVEGVVDMLAESAQRKGLELCCQVNANVPSVVRGDPQRLRQVLVNLVGNALKFTDAGDVVVRVGVAEEAGDAVVLRFDVSDTGIGISPANQGKLFRAFSQVDTTSTRRHGGTGLGLVISKELTTLMGGKIGVESEAGKGSTFWFTVKLTTLAAAPATPPALPQLAEVRALVVDDSAASRTILEKRLKRWGLRARTVGDGPTALARLLDAAGSGEPYELAIIDMHMPGMDGLELARAVRAEPSLAGVRLLLLTALGERERVEAERPAGAVATLGKPVQETKLFDAVVRLISQPLERSAPPAVSDEPSARRSAGGGGSSPR